MAARHEERQSAERIPGEGIANNNLCTLMKKVLAFKIKLKTMALKIFHLK